MVFNRHLKALNLCNHSDTIACVLYELLVNLELINVGFQTHDQGSTSFSFVQFSRSCCAASSRWQLVNYTTSSSVCQELFWSFFGFFGSFSTPQNPHKLLLWAFQRPSLAGQLDYITTGCRTLSTGFLNFLTNFGRNFWAVCILWWVGIWAQGVGGGRLRLPQNGKEGSRPLPTNNRKVRYNWESANFRQVCRGRIYASRAVYPLGRFTGLAATGGIYAAPTSQPAIFIIVYGRGRGVPRPY